MTRYRARVRTSIIPLTAATTLLAACSGGGKPVAFTLRTPGGEPISAAHIRAIAFNTNDVPLPVSAETLAALEAPLASGATDSRGVVRLALRPDGVYLLEVNPPPFGALADEGPWRWIFDPDAPPRPLTANIEGQVELRSGSAR